MKKVAVIVETREHKALPFVLENVTSVLPKDWELQIFHGTTNKEYVKECTKQIKNKVHMSSLGIDEITADDSSLQIMLTKSFWDKVVGEIVLYFECDSMLCVNSDYKIEQFEHLDYIGGYWGSDIGVLHDKYDRVMNGGLSLRKKSFMLDIIENKLQAYLDNGGNPCEDYFVSEMAKQKPTYEEVLSFSIDNGYIYPLKNKAPFGVHKPWGENKSKGHGKYYDKIKEVCHGVEELEKLNGV